MDIYLDNGYGSGGEMDGSLSPQGIPYLRFSSSNVSVTQDSGPVENVLNLFSKYTTHDLIGVTFNIVYECEGSI